MRNLFTHHTVEIPHKKFTLWFFSDMHFGTTAFDIDRFKWFLKRAAESENPYYLGVGDYTDFAAMSDNKKIKQADLHESTEERIDRMVQSDNAKIADLCKQMKGRLIGMIGGNHQYTFTTGKLSDEDLCERLQAKYLGWLSIIKLSLKIRNGFAVSCYIFACHGQGGGKLLGTSINKIDDMTRIINNADIYVMGHDHKRSATPKTVLSVYDNSGNFFLKQKRQYLVRSGSFQKSYEKDSSGFAQGRLMQPADLGAVRLNIGTHRDRKGGFDRIILDIEAVI